MNHYDLDQQKDLTLKSVKPPMSKPKVAIYTASLMALIGVMIVSAYWYDLNPLRLYWSYDKGWNYVFGRTLGQDEKDQARTEAEELVDFHIEQAPRMEIEAQWNLENPNSFITMEESEKLDAKIKAAVEARRIEYTPEKRAAEVEEIYADSIYRRSGGYFWPDTAWGNTRVALRFLVETIAMAIWGTILAIITAIPVSVFAAKNTLHVMVPGDKWYHRIIRWFSIFVVRRTLDSTRGFNEFVMALIFVAIVGLGPFAGILALAIHTFGILGKVFSEAIEAIDSGQVEGVLATGATSGSVITFSVIPQIMPTVISYSLLRFESNVRSATILGFVGAGGIGFLLQGKLGGYLYREVATIMIMIIVTVAIIDAITSQIRHRFI